MTALGISAPGHGLLGADRREVVRLNTELTYINKYYLAPSSSHRTPSSSDDSSLGVPWLTLILAERERRLVTFIPVMGVSAAASTRSRITAELAAEAQSATRLSKGPAKRESKVPAPGGVHSENEHRHKHEKLAANEAG